MKSYDYIIVGSGIAGLYAALLAREHGSVLVVTKGSVDDCNTRWAQGGIAAPIGPDDSPQKHYDDTIAAGAGLVDPDAARVLTAEAADRIDDLVRFGVPFDTQHGEIALAREGAHSAPRVLHAGGDSTGAHIELTLSSLAQHSNITVLEFTLATEIILSREAPHSAHPSTGSRQGESPPATGRAAVGVRALDERSGRTTDYACRHLVLATGGAGQLYRVSTNPEVATGNGIALAYRAGAEVMDMEFFQFHPTALRLPGVQPFLISEAVRGEGGVLLDSDGVRFMAEYDERGELAPRDIVARAILERMQRTGVDHVYLDVTHLPQALVIARFPQIYRFCLDHGLDITRQRIPVSPAAHYTMGGIRTNVSGETNIAGLYACGECACTGVHGANRLASNSLLETVIFAKRVVHRTLEAPGAAAEPAPDAIDLPPAAPAEACPEPVLSNVEGPSRRAPPPTREALQSLMWDEVGIVRDGEGLAQAKAVLSAWQASLPAPIDRPSHELADLVVCGRLVTEAALLREESRGAHYRSDFPQPREEWRRHIVFRRRA
ncbi:MAG: L-aspartate oxidase [Dehalococcoidia bacterium]|nr:L-aspartate oxidase [Dehalococcoidia bacterium]